MRGDNGMVIHGHSLLYMVIRCYSWLFVVTHSYLLAFVVEGYIDYICCGGVKKPDL